MRPSRHFLTSILLRFDKKQQQCSFVHGEIDKFCSSHGTKLPSFTFLFIAMTCQSRNSRNFLVLLQYYRYSIVAVFVAV